MKTPVSFASLIGRTSAAPPTSPLDLTKLNRAALLAERDRVLARFEAHNPPITRVIPVARAIKLGGESHVVDELRLGDLAEIQAWIESAEPHPLDGMPPASADPEPESRLARLAEAWEKARAWPPRLGTTRAGQLLNSNEGRTFFLVFCLSRRNPSFGLAQALELLPKITPAEWASLRRVAYGITPREEIAAELDDEDDGDGPPDWCRSVHNALQAEGCPDYRGIGQIYLSQWRNICSQGKAIEKRSEFGEKVKRVATKLKGRA
jgi:hypothetical protein